MDNKLTLKQGAFCKHMFTPGSDTFGNGEQSAKKARYKGNSNTLRQMAHKLVTNGNIIAEKHRIQAISEQEWKISIENQQAEHRRLAKLAEDKGDLTTATRNIELIGKTIGAYQDVHKDATVQQVELDESKRAAARRIASITLRERTA